MLPLVPALVLAFLSFIASAFVILRIVIPILPPHPLSKRVSPAEFGLPTFRKLSPADKGHLWLACLDLLALSLFVWQAVDESTSGPSGLALATNPGAAIRIWIVVTLRQTCLLFVAAITLLHIRMAQNVSFGARQWMLWAPTVLLIATSTTIAGLLSGTGVHSLFYGVTAYTVGVAVLSSVAFACLIRTLFVIKKNLTTTDELNDQWPPVREVEEKPRPSFATEDIDAIRDGASWITSDAGSKRYSASAWSFSTHHTAHSHGRPQTANHPSVPGKSSFWFGSATQNDIQVPPVPPLPSPYGPSSPNGPLSPAFTADPDPFRKESSETIVNSQKPRTGSQTSWLTSSAGSHTTITAWSFPETQHDGTHQEATTLRNPSPQDFHTAPNSIRGGSRPLTPAMANAQVLGGYGYMEAERGLTALAAPAGSTINISYVPAIGWSVMIWLPLAFALPYFVMLSQSNVPSNVTEILFILSVTLTSPLLAINLLCGSPLPIPVGLFDVHDSLPADPNRQLQLAGSFPPSKFSQFSHEYKRSTSCSVTVVEARRSGDVWLSKGDAVDGKGKIGRAVTMLSATPKLSVLPPEENPDELDMPPIPFREETSVHVHGTPNSETSVQFGRLRGAGSKQSSHLSVNRDSEEYSGGKIMTAQRHYSALAQTMIVPGGSVGSGSPGARDSVGANTLFSTTTGVGSKRNSHNSHLRSRSVTSVGPHSITGKSLNDEANYSPSPPPAFPLPPTPPNVRAARLAMLQHKKSFSSGFSLGGDHDADDIDNELNEIDAMTAGVLPILVPGLKLGEDMKIKAGQYSQPGTFSKSKGLKAMKKLTEFGEDFSSPEVHSTPARKRLPRSRKESGHKKNHFSLPSLSLGKEGLQSLVTWGSDIRHVLDRGVGQYTAVPSNVDMGRRVGVAGSESNIDAIAQQLGRVEEEDENNATSAKGLTRSLSKRTLGLRADVPHNVDTARSSYASVNNMPPPSAASTVTLFEEFEAELAMHSGPQAESTPHNSVSTKPVSRHPPPPMPPPKDHYYQQPPQRQQQARGSTIRYIKSDETPAENVRYAFEDTPPSNQQQPVIINPFSGSARTVRPLVPKASKLSRSPSDSTKEPAGLRNLTLLQDRGNIARNSSGGADGTRPLVLQAKAEKKMRRQNQGQDENAPPGGVQPTGTRNKNLKQLTLARSETSKQRAILRKTEVLPDVVVRPPSMSEHNSFSYSFRDRD